ncbi:MAG TPA: glycosyltransferase family 39 protein, partial [Gemmataceae bacterium]|nr:glycosyltransferase family 39 protein [Gemmataceae bacterium]
MTDGWVLALQIAGVVIGFPLLAWAFGSAVVARFTRLDREERFAAGFGVGFALAALCAFVAFVLHAPQPYFNLGAVALMLGFTLWCRLTTERRPEGGAAPVWPLAALFFLAYLHLVCLQGLLPAYWGSYWYFDWWMHYNEAQIFVGDESVTTTWANGYTVASRTPLFNLATAFVMEVGGRDFEVYQLASALTNISFVLSLYLLLRDLFGRRAAWLALPLAPLNLWMLHNAWFTWPKMLAAYYLILALHFYLQSVRQRPADPARAGSYLLCSGAAALLAYLTHQSTLFYALPLAAHAGFLAWRDRAFRPRPAELLACALLGVAVGGPWYAWLAGTLGAETILHSTPVTLGDDQAKLRPADVATWMTFDLTASVVPVGIGEAFVTGRPPDEPTPPWSFPVYRADQQWYVGPPDPTELYRGLTQIYFSLLTGALTLSLTAFLIGAGLRRLRRGPALPPAKPMPGGRAVWSAVWLSLAGGTLGGALLHPGKIPWGIAHSAVFPTAVVLAGLGWGLLSRGRPGTRRLVCCGMVLEFLLMFWSYRWLAVHDPAVIEPNVSGPRTDWVRMLNESVGG